MAENKNKYTTGFGIPYEELRSCEAKLKQTQ
jgi:hypothetical protein